MLGVRPAGKFNPRIGGVIVFGGLTVDPPVFNTVVLIKDVTLGFAEADTVM